MPSSYRRSAAPLAARLRALARSIGLGRADGVAQQHEELVAAVRLAGPSQHAVHLEIVGPRPLELFEGFIVDGPL